MRSPILSALLNWLVHVVRPTQPTRLVVDMATANAFLSERFGRAATDEMMMLAGSGGMAPSELAC